MSEELYPVARYLARYNAALSGLAELREAKGLAMAFKRSRVAYYEGIMRETYSEMLDKLTLRGIDMPGTWAQVLTPPPGTSASKLTMNTFVGSVRTMLLSGQLTIKATEGGQPEEGREAHKEIGKK